METRLNPPHRPTITTGDITDKTSKIYSTNVHQLFQQQNLILAQIIPAEPLG